MNPQLERANLLFSQNRFDLAEAELRQALAAEPHEPYAHALLALCLSERKEFAEATTEAQQAVHLAPDFPYAHYALAHVWSDRHHLDKAVAALAEAIRLDPFEADYFALLSQLRLEQRKWNDALVAAEQGLQIDSEHVACANLRAIALVKLGRKAEAGRTIDAALARNPENALSHANQGWTLLEQGDSRRALEHFREALRLEPQNEWARLGIIEALKARHFIYALMLRYFLFMSKLSAGAQWGIIIGGWFGVRLLAGMARANPALAPWVLPVRILYVVFVILAWIADPLFNLFLRLNRFGRLALSREQTIASNWLAATLFPALFSLGACFFTGWDHPFLLSAVVFGLLALPTAGVFKCSAGWPRITMAIATGLLAAVGLCALFFFVSDYLKLGQPGSKTLLEAGKGLLDFFLMGILFATIGANILILQRPKR